MKPVTEMQIVESAEDIQKKFRWWLLVLAVSCLIWAALILPLLWLDWWKWVLLAIVCSGILTFWFTGKVPRK